MTSDIEPKMLILEFWKAYYDLSNTLIALKYAISGVDITKNPTEAPEIRENTK